MTSKSADLRLELEYLRDNVVEGAATGKTGLVEAGLDAYAALIETFLAVLVEFDAPYDKKHAQAELHSIGSGWAEIEWIRDDYREIADSALFSTHLTMVLQVAYFPVRLIHLAFRKRDYYIFAQFLRWIDYLYLRSFDKGIEFGSLLRERLSRYLVETSKWLILSALEETSDVPDIKRVCDFAGAIAIEFNRLLKASYDRRNIEDFRAFIRALTSLYDRYDDYDSGFSSRREEPDGRADSEMDPQFVRNDCWSRLILQRDILFLGLDAWLLRDWERGDLEDRDVRQWHDALPLPADPAELWAIYIASRDRQWEDDLGWSWWEVEEHSGETVFSGMAFDVLLLAPVLIRVLNRLAHLSPAAREAFRLKPTEDLDYLASSQGAVLSMLNAVKYEGRWDLLLDDEVPQHVDFLISRFTSAREEYRETERRGIREREVSTTRVAILKQEVIRGLTEPGHVRDIIQRHGEIGMLGDPPEGLDFLTINTLDRKDLYIEDPKLLSFDWGTEYGRALARGEDDRALRVIASTAPSAAPRQGDQADTVSFIEDSVEALSRSRHSLIILIGNSWEAQSALSRSRDFQYKDGRGDRDSGGFGQFREIPVYTLHGEVDPFVAVLDARKAVEWRQYLPRTREAESEILGGFLLFLVQTFSESEARDFLENHPNLLLQKDERLLPPEERILLLQEHVRLLIQEQFEFVVTRPKLVRAMRVPEPY